MSNVLYIAPLALFLCLSACSGVTVESNADGTHEIDCSGGYYDWSRCHKAAERICEQYDVVGRISDESSASVGVNNWEQEGSIVTRVMTVRCVSGS